MAQERHTQCFSLLFWEESEHSTCTLCQVRAGQGFGFARALDDRIQREAERTEALEWSDRLDRWWQMFYSRYGPH